MSHPQKPEARITTAHNLLVACSPLQDEPLRTSFCGAVFTPEQLAAQPAAAVGRSVWLSGDLSRVDGRHLEGAARVFVVEGSEHNPGWPVVDLGRVPVLVAGGVGVLYRRFFEPGEHHFQRVCAEHVFQALTESTKPGTAHRTGIYLCPVQRDGDDLRFHLLRCSTNLAGPTDNFRATDRHIVDALNAEADRVFEGAATLNHVLAQVYPNTPATGTQRQTKARIKAHADKTKDMPRHGVMAFCTFYDGLDGLSPMAGDPFDLGHKTASGLTRLHFHLKECVAERPDNPWPHTFTVTLYPGSVFFMPLSTNRRYTHEIRPSMLDAERLPTRLGYVVRCSKTEAVHRDGQTFLVEGDTLRALEPPTPEGMAELRGLYAEENRRDDFIDYGARFGFSMNQGDTLAPEHRPEDAFRRYALPASEDLFPALRAAAGLEAVTGGRQGGVLVLPDPARGTPIVRTTTRYDAPARRFQPVHLWLARQIERRASLALAFNNALIEVYTEQYRKMGAHSDQALDLAPGSDIALFSCYEHPEGAPSRVLEVESKAPGGGAFRIPLTQNSVVVFSLETNRRFRHRIVLDRAEASGNAWLGLTLRTSKTFVRHGDGVARFEDGTPLQLADEAWQRDLFRLRGRENRETDFTWPAQDITVSPSDLLPPEG